MTTFKYFFYIVLTFTLQDCTILLNFYIHHGNSEEVISDSKNKIKALYLLENGELFMEYENEEFFFKQKSHHIFFDPNEKFELKKISFKTVKLQPTIFVFPEYKIYVGTDVRGWSYTTAIFSISTLKNLNINKIQYEPKIEKYNFIDKKNRVLQEIEAVKITEKNGRQIHFCRSIEDGFKECNVFEKINSPKLNIINLPENYFFIEETNELVLFDQEILNTKEEKKLNN